MHDYRFAGYRVVEFSSRSKDALQDIASALIPEQGKILSQWMRRQWAAWQPPGISRRELAKVFGEMMRGMLTRLHAREPEQCLSDLDVVGADLAARDFPFEALIISVHFFEESYLPYLLKAAGERAGRWLVRMDEFLHAALASVATAYFNAYREELLDRAEVGRIVQEGLLADIPRQACGLEIGHTYISARERARLGGDFLDFFFAGESAAFVIGDLSGHGLEAAATSVMLRSLFKGFMREHADLGQAMARLNRALIRELDTDQFATALALTCDSSGRVRLVNAGHPYPILCENSTCTAFEVGGEALAVDDETDYSASQVRLPRGGLLVAYTDGLTEARDGSDLFGEEGVIRALLEVAEAPANAIAEHLVDHALRHAGGKLTDDLAILVLRRIES